MKKLLFGLALLPFFSFKCEKEKYGDWMEGKVVRLSCASFVVQLTSNTTTGEDGWKDMMNNDTTYNDVITASNKCAIPDGLEPGNIIRFKIEQPKTENNCYICTLYDAPPQKMYDIKHIKVISTGNK